MRYLFVGDTHGEKDLDKLKLALPGLGLSPRDALIHCGDWGAPWIEEEDEALRWWRQLPLKKIICLGNHENYGWILRQPVVRRYGALGRDLGGGLFAPLPGQIAQIGCRSFWFYPGGLSIDFPFRRPGRSIFREELLPQAEAEAALSRLFRAGHVDYVISHDGPKSMVERCFGFQLRPPPAVYHRHLGEAEGARVHPAFLLDRVYERPELFARWYFGHHHQDLSEGRLRCLWQAVALEDSRGEQARIIEAEGTEQA